ncbi:BAR_ACAPs and ArfGap_ACAP domain-containing protein isoform X2 [Fundulus heteroclitus]|uniref:BAR_ACAPs and ArfGap_ACAP domain-containing protein isoform X2 n=1 Tax=Fundulus heteroclitus TaxID=8078 RepID=UPI00165A1B16|nr:BAR_ACAPs and ArfGap_ACAP domain-containing protein isoform X2 [Fundulus heteroclitus]
MEPLLDFEECIKDSPEFRLTLDQFEADVSLLETQLEKVMKLCGKMVEAGQAYNAANQLFLGGLAELLSQQKKEPVMMSCLQQFQQGLQEMLSFHTMLLDQTQRAIVQQLTNLCSFLPQLADTRKEFLRIGDDLETAAAKNAQVSRHKAADAERASHLLLATRKCYQHFALDYCLQLNAFKTQQKMDVLNSVFSFVHAQFTFFHQGFDLLRDLEPSMKTMGAQLSQLSADCAAKRKELENRHLLVQQRDASGEQMVGSCPGSGAVIQGYLFKRSRRKPKTWKRCWFTIRDNRLVYRKSHKEDAAVLFEDLRLCAVKPAEHLDRRFCFELLSVQRCCALQADSEPLKQAWLGALQGSIDLAYRERSDARLTQAGPLQDPAPLPCAGDASPPSHRPAVLAVALGGPGNRRCCDCGEEEPRWASVNLGVTVCIQCSGIHRSLGVHLSKIRSLTLDSWENEQLKLLCVLGNDVVNRIYEARCSEDGRVKPGPDSPRSEKEAWIRAKYVEKRFVRRSVSDGAQPPKGAGLHLYRAACAGDIVAMATALAEGSEVNGSVAEEEGRTALIGAAVGGSLSACEFLLQNGANVNHRDLRGRGALHAAATAGHTGQVCLLLKRGANQYAVDERGQDPLAIAVETANADIVTLLRMARMNEEMRDSEGVFSTTGDDETFQDIFRDFSDMASNDPEKLSRRLFSRGAEEEEEEEEEGGGGGGGGRGLGVGQTSD